ncbi:stomatin-like protein 1 isoform X2 [Chlorocebus sabaeus]|uniref:stomatin-like protein 1 isoform X2 n=1 Tax=Macaca fascicularis TaxID=9541 RepID=UPI0001D55CDC|nr:stomatin-like protein 1 isoform X2 [Macaca fascicularis]XP_008014137.1 stomatin-like protein 1 isoform X2 [Chlorocebus sabaeus]XP_011709358.1 stomatin-like protein 1 isoform X2 [Macaca nemestrina]XP_050653706.1 stomatin-like protein 1 isoform X2 [Macaca thibetana thibetana]
MLGRSGYRALPLGDFDRFQQSSFGFLGSQKGCLSPERGGVGTGADAPQSWPSCLCHGLISFLGFLLLLVTFPISGWFALKIVPTYERMIVFRLGRIRTPQGPGMVLLLPFIDSFQRVDLRTRAFNVPPCKLASKDGAVLSVGADVQFRIWDPVLSVMTVKDLNTATRMTAQNAMTKALLKRPLREIQMEKLKISDQLLLEINDVTRAWGLEVDRVELAVEAVLQPPQDSPTGPNLDSTLQQLALHFLGGSMNSVAGGAPSPGPDTVEMVSEVEPPAPQVGARPSPKQPLAEGLLTALQPFLSEALVNQVGACYQFNVVLPSGTQSAYFLDLTTGQGRVGHGVPDGIPDVVVEMAEADLRALLCRELRPLGAYMSGRLKVKGDLAVAMKLEAVLRALK